MKNDALLGKVSFKALEEEAKQWRQYNHHHRIIRRRMVDGRPRLSRCPRATSRYVLGQRNTPQSYAF